MTDTTSSHAPFTQAAPEHRMAVGVALAAMFMAVMDGYIVIVAGPDIQADLGATSGQLQWVLAAYQLSYAVAMVTAGRIADLVGRRRVLLLGTAVFTVTSVLCALAPGAELLIAARLVQGLGAAMVVPQVFALITLLVPRPSHPRLFGVVSIVIATASMAGQLVGGSLVGLDALGTGWRAVFWVNLPIGVAILVLAARFVPESRVSTRGRLDLRGVALLSATLLLLTLPLIQGREWGWPWWTWVLFAGSVVSAAAFVGAQRRTELAGRVPLLQLSLFTQRAFSVGLLLVTALYALLTSYYLALSVTLQDGLGLSPLEAGLVYAPAPVTFFVFGVIAGRLVPRHGRRVLEVGAIVLAAGYLSTAIAVLATDAVTVEVVVPTLVLQAVGGGLVITPSLNVVLSRVDSEAVGMASGALSTAQQVGAALGVAVVGALFFSAYRPEVDGRAEAAVHGFATASLAVFAVAVVASVLVALLPRTRGE